MAGGQPAAGGPSWTPSSAVQRGVRGGWICATWPAEYGGKGLSTMEAVVLAEEFERAGVPLRADFFGDTLVGPTILRWGTEAQKKEFLPQILSGRISWCQGFSEPDAGSDLASVKTRAELDGDEWVIHGQKLWTTQAHEADYIFLLARTDPDAPKHAGISYLLVPMKQPGIEVRPIAQPDGSAEFNEVFFDGARCPRDNVVGGVNNGWTVAMTTLGFERGTSATTGYRRFKKELDEMIGLAQGNGKAADPLVRQRLAEAWTKVKIMQINGYRSLTAALGGAQRRRGGGAGGDQQDVLVRVPPGGDGTGHRHPGDERSGAERIGGAGVRPRLRAAPATARLPGQRPAVVVLLLPIRDHLGRHGPDPAEHRGRADTRPSPGAPAGQVARGLFPGPQFPSGQPGSSPVCSRQNMM